MHIGWLRTSAVFGFTGVVLGAFGGHVLKSNLEPKFFEIFQIGIQYHFVHTLALLILAFMAVKGEKNYQLSCLFFTAGTIIFSGSLYIYSLTQVKVLTLFTPVGGLI